MRRSVFWNPRHDGHDGFFGSFHADSGCPRKFFSLLFGVSYSFPGSAQLLSPQGTDPSSFYRQARLLFQHLSLLSRIPFALHSPQTDFQRVPDSFSRNLKDPRRPPTISERFRLQIGLWLWIFCYRAFSPCPQWLFSRFVPIPSDPGRPPKFLASGFSPVMAFPFPTFWS